jgi:hypothetical protein
VRTVAARLDLFASELVAKLNLILSIQFRALCVANVQDVLDQAY